MILIARCRKYSYLETYNMMRDITGVGKGKGPFIAFHDGFSSLAAPVAAGGWNGFLNGWDRVAIDSHRYLCFADPNNWGLGYQATLVSPFLPCLRRRLPRYGKADSFDVQSCSRAATGLDRSTARRTLSESRSAQSGPLRVRCYCPLPSSVGLE